MLIRRMSLCFAALAIAGLLLARCGAGVDPTPTQEQTYPLKKSPNGRYLVDQKNVPFLIVGDSPQAIMVNISEADADSYFANRASYGFNAVWINLLNNEYCQGRPDSSTIDGILPWTTAEDLSTPNEAYFAHCDRVLRLAEKYGLVVFLNPAETGGFLRVMLNNGVTNCRDYGRYLGNRYKSFDNIVWMSGSDFQEWQDPANDAVVTALALGIRETDTRHIHTVQLNYSRSGSLDDSRWAPIISLNASYTYLPTYAQVLKDYNRLPFLPVFMVEADYEFENGADTQRLRRQEYWTNLSGATGQFFGNGYIWPFKSGWKEYLDTPGAIQMAYVKALFAPRAWYSLVPDQDHTVVTLGYGTFMEGTGYDVHTGISASDYVTAARTPDGTLVIAYVPTSRTITVDMTQLSAPAMARWYDPASGKFQQVSASKLPNTGPCDFTTPGDNAEGPGNTDWILVLETQPL
jgi:hypothetical protein